MRVRHGGIDALDPAKAVGVHGQGPLRRNFRIESAQAACGAIARVGQGPVAALQGALVVGVHASPRHVDFASNFDTLRNVVAKEFQGHARDSAHVGGDVLARGAVAPCGRKGQRALLIRQGNRHAVDLRLTDERDLLAAQAAPAAFRPGADGLAGTNFLKGQHGYGMRDLRERCKWLGTDTLRRGVRANERRVRRFESDQLVV